MVKNSIIETVESLWYDSHKDKKKNINGPIKAIEKESRNVTKL